MVRSMMTRKGLVERITRFERSGRLKEKSHMYWISVKIYTISPLNGLWKDQKTFTKFNNIFNTCEWESSRVPQGRQGPPRTPKAGGSKCLFAFINWCLITLHLFKMINSDHLNIENPSGSKYTDTHTRKCKSAFTHVKILGGADTRTNTGITFSKKKCFNSLEDMEAWWGHTRTNTWNPRTLTWR